MSNTMLSCRKPQHQSGADNTAPSPDVLQALHAVRQAGRRPEPCRARRHAQRRLLRPQQVDAGLRQLAGGGHDGRHLLPGQARHGMTREGSGFHQEA